MTISSDGGSRARLSLAEYFQDTTSLIGSGERSSLHNAPPRRS
jgi:hypothetical protein